MNRISKGSMTIIPCIVILLFGLFSSVFSVISVANN